MKAVLLSFTIFTTCCVLSAKCDAKVNDDKMYGASNNLMTLVRSVESETSDVSVVSKVKDDERNKIYDASALMKLVASVENGTLYEVSVSYYLDENVSL